MIDPQEIGVQTKQVRAHGDTPVPAARPLNDFAYEQVGDEFVLFDVGTMQYHTLNATAYQIWSKCDGGTSASAIAAELDLTVEVVQETINDLGVASLLQSPPESWPTVMTRRRATKYIAAGVAGAIGAPVVLSMTAPSHQAAASGCSAEEAQNSPYVQGGTCSPQGSYQSCSQTGHAVWCCNTGGSLMWWTDPNVPGWNCNPLPVNGAANIGSIDDLDYVDDPLVVDAAADQVDMVEVGDPAPAEAQVVEEMPAEVQLVPEVQSEPVYVEVVEAPAETNVNADTSVEPTAGEPDKTVDE